MLAICSKLYKTQKNIILAFKNFISIKQMCKVHTNSLWNRHFWKASLDTEESQFSRCLTLPLLSLFVLTYLPCKSKSCCRRQLCAVGEGVNKGHYLLPCIYSNCRYSSFAFFHFLCDILLKKMGRDTVTIFWWEEARVASSQRPTPPKDLVDFKTGQDRRKWGQSSLWS